MHEVGGQEAHGKETEDREGVAGEDEEPAKDAEDPVLVGPGHCKGREDESEDEDVVDGQALLDDVAGVVLAGRLGTEHPPDDQADAQPETHPDGGPEGGFAERPAHRGGRAGRWRA